MRNLLAPFTVANLLSSLLLTLPYGIAHWRWHDGCLEFVAKRNKEGVTRIWGRPGGQSLGCQVIWYAREDLWHRADLRVHERVHSWQGLWVNAVAHAVLVPGVLLLGLPWWVGVFGGQLAFGASYGGHFLWCWARGGFGPWKSAYFRIWAERQAYSVQSEFEAGHRDGAWGA